MSAEPSGQRDPVSSDHLVGPARPAPPDAPPDTVGDLVGSYLRTQCRVILGAETALRAGEDVVHPTRVAIRRLRSTLRVFGELVEPPAGEGWRTSSPGGPVSSERFGISTSWSRGCWASWTRCHPISCWGRSGPD